MHETPHGFFHLDHPSDQAEIPSGQIVLRGWMAGTNGRPLVDLRIKLDQKHFPAIYGFPRPDLAQFFGLPQPFLPGGFEANLDLPSGRHEIIFEALTISGVWQTIATMTVTCLGELMATEPAAPPTVQPHEFARLLQCALRSNSPQNPATAASDLIEALPAPAVIRYPHMPFHGHLHQPTLLERVLFGRLRIEGWLFHELQEIRQVAASIDLQVWQTLVIGGSKAYVEAMYPQFPQAKNCRIDGLIDMPAQIPNPRCVRIYAELSDGSWHLCHVQRVHTWDQEHEKTPFISFSRIAFLRRARALYRTGRAAGLEIHTSHDFWRGIRGVYQEYQLRAQPRRDLKSDSFTSPQPPAAPEDGALRHVTLITHNLSREGAPLFLYEFAQHLAATGTRLRVISTAPGPLAMSYQQLGATVEIVDPTPLHVARSPKEQRTALENIGAQLALKASTDLVVANTLSTWWGVHLAHRAQLGSLFYIHESTTPATFYLGHLRPFAIPLIEQSFQLATHVSFLTETTRVYYRPWLGKTNHSINPGWIDLPSIDRALVAQSRDQLRKKLNLAAATRLVVNLGSVCDRKGQHIFARGVDLLWQQHPEIAATCLFLMVGGRDTLFDADMHQLLAQLNRANLQIVPTTNAPIDYLGAADLFVCSSYEESFPRVVMEAMACRVPILSTAVHGITDQIRHGHDGWLVPAGHTQAIAEGLHHMLTSPALLTEMAVHARDRVTSDYDATVLLPRHLQLATSVAFSRHSR